MTHFIHAFTDDAIGNLDATGIAQAIQSKGISTKEVVEATIARIEKVNPTLQAMVLDTYEDAKNVKSANQNGALYGVPTFVKDNDNIKGYPTQYGTGVFQAKPAKKNSKYVQQMLHTGLNVIGKSTMPEFGLICSTENEKWGITRNPWNVAYTPGGSSSGSGALVASGAVAIAQANDGAGSTRIPASCCGLVGLKPTRNRLVNFEGSEIMPINIGYQGVLTRTVRDTALFFAEAEKYFKNPKLPDIGHVKHPLNKRLKIVVFENAPQGSPGHVDEDTERVYQNTARLLENLGHSVEVMKMPIDVEQMVHHYLNYYGFLAFLMTRLGSVMFKSKIDLRQLEPFSYGLSNIFVKNIFQFPKSVQALKKEIVTMEKKLFSQFDIILTPVTSIKTPKIGYFSPLYSSKEIVKRAAHFAPFTGMQNVSGAPAISLPMGVDSNKMPLGMQFSAKYGQDSLLLELAYELEAAQPWKKMYEVN